MGGHKTRHPACAGCPVEWVKVRNSCQLEISVVMPGQSDPSIRCDFCSSACCRSGIKLTLSPNELDTLVSAGTKLRSIDPGRHATNLVVGKKLYELVSDCGHMVVDPMTSSGKCNLWGDGRRPEVCGLFPTGSDGCIKIQRFRIESGQDTNTPTNPPRAPSGLIIP